MPETTELQVSSITELYGSRGISNACYVVLSSGYLLIRQGNKCVPESFVFRYEYVRFNGLREKDFDLRNDETGIKTTRESIRAFEFRDQLLIRRLSRVMERIFVFLEARKQL